MALKEISIHENESGLFEYIIFNIDGTITTITK